MQEQYFAQAVEFLKNELDNISEYKSQNNKFVLTRKETLDELLKKKFQ